MDTLPLDLVGDGALRAAVAADREAARWEAATIDHLVEYLLGMCERGVRQTHVPGAEEAVPLGGPGTPEVPEFVVCEVAAAMALSQPAATSLVADALDLGVRLPATLAAVRNGSLRLVRARTIARGTRDLDRPQAAVVEERLVAVELTDEGWVPLGARVTPGRLRALLEQAVIVARGPEEAEVREERAREGMCVDVVGDRDGVADLYARLGSEDAARLHTRLDQVAGWLARLGDERTHRVLRAVAVGYLADPAMLTALQDLAAQAPPLPERPTASQALAARLAQEREQEDAGPPRFVEESTASPVAGPDVAAVPPALGGETATAPGPGLEAERTRTDAPPAAPRGDDDEEATRRRAELMCELARRLEGERRSVLYLHLDAASGTCSEEQLGAMTREHLADVLSHSRVMVRPVLDLAAELSYTGYVAPPLLRLQRALLNAGQCAFPHCHRRARAGDVDHEVPYPRRGGSPFVEPGVERSAQGRSSATTSSNTHMLCRKHHRAKTHGGWQVTSPAHGVWLWRSPAGAHHLVTAGTTTALNGIHDARPHTGTGATTSTASSRSASSRSASSRTNTSTADSTTTTAATSDVAGTTAGARGTTADSGSTHGEATDNGPGQNTVRGPIEIGDHEEAGAADVVGGWSGSTLDYRDTG